MGEVAAAWLAGGSGLVGGELLRRLLRDDTFTAVVSFGRRMLPVKDPKLAQVAVDFSTPATIAAGVGPDVAFSCLGTTMSKAGSRDAFRAIDHDAVLAFARAARERGARTLVHVSALGADPRSRVFYNAVKGALEEDVARLGFDSVYALRPSILDGVRPERRTAERAALVVARALGPLLGKYRPTPAGAVADAMLAAARAPRPGVHVVEGRTILSSGPRAVQVPSAAQDH
jgi:uncharacterized protein YbjT (DUF2867 family)